MKKVSIYRPSTGQRSDRRRHHAGGTGRIRPVPDKYPMLVQAVNKISSPEPRNVSTLGGDLSQKVGRQYLRGGYSCRRNGGYLCAMEPSAMTATIICASPR
jgi:CO/xanthine dehydrogenase FAD-binding subunit